MVMATGNVYQHYTTGELPQEVGDTSDDTDAAAAALHERLVAYVHALASGNESRSGVWVEHSYARARGAASAPAAHVRVLLAPRLEPEPGDVVDVMRVDPALPDLLPSTGPGDDDDDDDCGDEWEARVIAMAPSAAHARLAERALDALRRLRLARLAGEGGEGGGAGLVRHHALRAAARRLRLALGGAAAHPRAGAWLHTTLLAVLPRGPRRLYEALAAELVREAPRLARWLPGVAPAPHCALGAVGRARGPGAGPWLVWVGCGRARQDERWTRRLGALVHTRVVAAQSAAAAAPEAWCAAVAGSVRAALTDTLAEAGDRPVILGGIGAGATLCAALAPGVGGGVGGGAARVCGLLLLAPPLLTAEGPRDAPDDPLAEVRLAMLLVVGTGAAQCWRGAAREVARARAGAGARRVLEVRGADDALRLPAAPRRRLPQHALDAAIAEECARWAVETAESAGSESPARERERERERPRRRGASPAPLTARRAGDPRAAALLKNERVLTNDDVDEEEYAHLPTTNSRPVPSSVPHPGMDRPIEIMGEFSGRQSVNSSLDTQNCVTIAEGRVVSRGSGGTPLALLPPRRRTASPTAPPTPAAPSAPAAPPAPLAAADIMRLPIVFADDELRAGESSAPASPVTVTSGVSGGRGAGGGGGGGAGVGGRGARYARVIVASRGRPVLLRRGVRMLPRDNTPR